MGSLTVSSNTMEETKFEYVLSGCGHTLMTLKDCGSDAVAPYVREIIKKAEAKLEDHTITGLYNAFAEANNGANLYKGKFFSAPLHADSGGLQMITLGKGVTEELKNKVYESQAKHSGVAMCFDDIPATQEKNVSLRLFKEGLVEEKAKATALNVVEQAKAFERLKTDAKIFLIIQGNCVDTYHKWADICVKNIPEDLHHWIGGISMAGTTSGTGDREDVDRIYAFSTLPVPREWKRQIHLLGIGSASRMLSVTGFMHSGLIEDYTRVSYDSTTHSSALTFRRYVDEDSKTHAYGWDRTETEKIYNITKQYYDIHANFDEYFDIVNESRTLFIEKYPFEELYKYHEAMIATCMVSVYHCAAQLEQQYSSVKKYKRMCTGKLKPLQHLTEIKNPADYQHYMNQVGKYLTSKKVKRDDEFSSLDSFFY